MRRRRFQAILLSFFTTTAVASVGAAQQSFFNVPAGEIASSGRLFAQAQNNFTRERGELNLTVDLGISSFFEVGCNIFHVPFYDISTAPFAGTVDSATTLNASFLAKPLPWIRLTVGAQAGMGWRGMTTGAVPVVEGWALARFDVFGERLRMIAGGYAGTISALGTGWPAGPMAGVEVVAIRDRLHFMGDWIIGLNSASVAVLGVVALLPAGTQISAGLQVPSPNSGNALGGVLELTYVPEGSSRTPDTDEDQSPVEQRSAPQQPATTARSHHNTNTTG